MVQRISEGELARITALIAKPPNLRDHPTDSSERQFDGGLMRMATGIVTYEFDDGVRALVGVFGWFSMSITFPDGAHVRIEQAHASNGERLSITQEVIPMGAVESSSRSTR